MYLVAFQKMFREIFSGIWLYSWKYHRKHIFYLLLTFSHIFLVAKRIYNIIHSSIQKHKQNPEKKLSNPVTFSHIFSVSKQIYNIIHSLIQKHKQNLEKKKSSNPVKLREEEREATGFDEGLQSARCFTRSWSTLHKIAIRAVLREIAISTKARSRSMVRSFSLCASVSHSFSLSFSLCASMSSSLSTSQFWKWFEGKIKTEIILQDQRTHLTVNGSYFSFDPIFRTNKTPTFSENHFRNQFKAKTNGA